MEYKIEVGEYVRTDNGYIAKLIERDIEDEDVKDGMLFDNYIHRDHKQMRESGIRKCCKKHSKNIIDLIEVSDYVNGYKVINVINGENAPSGKCVDIDSAMDSSLCTFWEEDIKSIVTHEQFVNVEYKVEEKK